MAVEFTAINAGAEIMTGGGSSQGKNSPEIAGNTGVLCSPRSVTQGIKKPRRALVGSSTIPAVRGVWTTTTLTATMTKRVIQVQPLLAAESDLVVAPTSGRRGTAPLKRRGRRQPQHPLPATLVEGRLAKSSLIAGARGGWPGRQGQWAQQARPLGPVLDRTRCVYATDGVGLLFVIMPRSACHNALFASNASNLLGHSS